MEKTFKERKYGQILSIFFIALLSFVSVFGIYNNFKFVPSLYDMFITIGQKSSTEMWALVAISVIFVFVMGSFQGIHVKKLSFGKRIGFFFFILLSVIAIGLIILYFTKDILPSIVIFLVLGTTMYMFELVLQTLGFRGLFFFLALFGLFIVYLFKSGVREVGTLVTVSQAILAFVFFLGAAYPRIKEVLFHIGTRDNIDIPNSDEEEL